MVGHSQGGAVAFQCAAQRSKVVRGVCALASQTKGVPPTSAMRALVDDGAARVAILHGAADAVLKPRCAEDLAARCGLRGGGARGRGGRVDLEIVPGADHQFDGRGPRVRSFVDAWVAKLAGSAAVAVARAPAAGADYAASKENERTRRSAQRYIHFVFAADEVLDGAASGRGLADARRAVDALRERATNSAAAAAGNGLDPDEADAVDAARKDAADALRACGLEEAMRLKLRRESPPRHALLHQVLDGLYCGGWAALNDDCAALKAKKIARVVSLVTADEPRKLGAFVTDHLHVVVKDDPRALLCAAFPAIVRFVERGRAAGERVYIHCGAGISRACAATCAYVMWKGRLNSAAAMKLVKGARPQARPNVGFLHQLRAWESAKGGVGLDDGDDALPTARGAGGARVAIFRCAMAPA